MFRLPFELSLALRYFRPRGTYVSIVTLIAVVGVTLAVAVLIVVIAVMSGFGRELQQKIIGFNAHIQIVRPGGSVADPARLAEAARRVPEVTGVTPFVLGQVLVETQREGEATQQASAPWLRGMDPATEGTVSVLPRSIREGTFDPGRRGVLVGVEFAANLGLRVGDRLAVYSPRNLQRMRDARRKNADEAALPDDFTVRGIFDVGHYEYNATVIVTSLADAQELYELDDEVHGLLVNTRDPMRLDAVSGALQAAAGPEHRLRTWWELNPELLGAIVMEKKLMFILLFVIMLVAAFSIMGTLITFVIQKTREIGVLKALGATRAQVAWVFLGQGALVGVIGVGAGLASGLALLAWRNEALSLLNSVTGLNLFPASVYAFSQLPALVLPGDLALTCGGALALCVAAGALPALKAASAHPVEALRHE